MALVYFPVQDDWNAGVPWSLLAGLGGFEAAEQCYPHGDVCSLRINPVFGPAGALEQQSQLSLLEHVLLAHVTCSRRSSWATLQTNSTRSNWSNVNKVTACLYIGLYLHGSLLDCRVSPDVPGVQTLLQAVDCCLPTQAGELQRLPLAYAEFISAPAQRSKAKPVPPSVLACPSRAGR
jgi:hypothetical protein